MVVAAEPVRRDQAVQRPARHHDDVQQLRHQELEQHPVRASIGRRHRALVCGARSRRGAGHHGTPGTAQERPGGVRPPPVRSGDRERIRRVPLPRMAPGAGARADHRGRSGVGQLPARSTERSPVAGRVSCRWLCARCGAAIHPNTRRTRLPSAGGSGARRSGRRTRGIDTVRTRIATLVFAVAATAAISTARGSAPAWSCRARRTPSSSPSSATTAPVRRLSTTSHSRCCRRAPRFPSRSCSCSATTCTAARSRRISSRSSSVRTRPLLDAGVRFYAALGNHDQPTNRSYPPFNMAGERYYTFAKASGPLRRARHQPDGSARSWRGWKTRSRGPTSRGRSSTSIIRLYSDGDRHGSNVELRVILEPLLVRHGVHVVFSGHEHIYERTTPQKGITYFIQGSSGQLRKGGVTPSALTAASFAEDRTFMLVEIAGDQMVFQTISRTGRVVDSGVIHRATWGIGREITMKAHALSRPASPWLHSHQMASGVASLRHRSFSVAAAGRRDRARLGQYGCRELLPLRAHAGIPGQRDRHGRVPRPHHAGSD